MVCIVWCIAMCAHLICCLTLLLIRGLILCLTLLLILCITLTQFVVVLFVILAVKVAAQ